MEGCLWIRPSGSCIADKDPCSAFDLAKLSLLELRLRLTGASSGKSNMSSKTGANHESRIIPAPVA